MGLVMYLGNGFGDVFGVMDLLMDFGDFVFC